MKRDSTSKALYRFDISKKPVWPDLHRNFTTMPPKRQIKHLKEIRALSHGVRQEYLNAKQFTFSILVTGLNYKSVSECMLWNNIHPPSSHMFYEAQREISPILTSMARESCDAWRESMLSGSIIALDGSWSHRRNAARCMVDFIDARTNKVVDFEVVLKSGCRIEGNYSGPSNGMEREALRRMIPRWQTDQRVIGYCHDNDGKTRKTIRDFGWNITEFLDRNHLMKSFDRTYDKFEHKKLLRGLKDRLRHWMLILLGEDITLERKKYFWEVVTVEHFSGHHEHCPEHKEVACWRYSGDVDHVTALKEFLLLTSHYLEKCCRLVSTQMNESLHALKAHYANKMFCWGKSWTIRACVAILQINEPETWKFRLFSLLDLPPLDPQIEHLLVTAFHSLAVENELRRRPEFRVRVNTQRKSRRAANKKRESQCKDYGHAPPVQRDEEEDEGIDDEDIDDKSVGQVCDEADDIAPEVFTDEEDDPPEYTESTGTHCQVS